MSFLKLNRALSVLLLCLFSTNIFAEYDAVSLDGIDSGGSCSYLLAVADHYEQRCKAYLHSNDVTMHKIIKILEPHPVKGQQCDLDIKCYECRGSAGDLYVGLLEQYAPGTCATECPAGTKQVGNACQPLSKKIAQSDEG